LGYTDGIAPAGPTVCSNYIQLSVTSSVRSGLLSEYRSLLTELACYVYHRHYKQVASLRLFAIEKARLFKALTCKFTSNSQLIELTNSRLFNSKP
jgi:hypothetical protein